METPSELPAQLSAERDLLWEACQLVAAASGITIRHPPATRMVSSSRDPVDEIAAASRVRTRQVILKGTWWQRDNGPLLAYREQDKQPVALLPRTPQRYDLIEPATGIITPVTPAVATTLDALAVTFYRSLPERPLGARDLLRFGLIGGLRDWRVAIVAGIGVALLALAEPLVIERLVGTLIPTGQSNQIVLLGLALAVAAITAAAFTVTRNIALLRLESRADATLQAALWDRLMSLPVSFFRAYAAGDLGERAMGISTVRQTLSGTTIAAFFATLFSLVSFGLMVYYDLPLALLVLGLASMLALGTALGGPLQIQRWRAMSELQGQIAGLVLQFITSIAKFRVSGAESRAYARWAERFDKQTQLAYRAAAIDNIIAAGQAAYPILALIAIYAIVASRGAHLSTNTFLAFSAAAAQFTVAVLTCSSALTSVIGVLPLYERARPILLAVPEANEMKQPPGELSGAINIDRVSFRYKADGPVILDDISLQINPGECIALVGPSGSGKSTLMRLLLGFERPTSGAIRYDGQDLATLDVRQVRSQFGVVLQNSTLMTDDILHNIIGVSRLTVEDAWDAARRVGLADDIEQMPMGMYTVVSEGGTTFSGGQRQRMLLARAIAHKPRILLLDEATSALDNTTQALVADSLAQIQATRIIVAHRLSTIMRADRIYVFANGSIMQCGTYAELIQQAGLFADLARRQLA